MARSDGRAVVVGASMAGLLTARVLTEFFSQVTLLDRDDLTGGPVPRRGVPQSRQSHALLSGGVQALQTLFPDLVADLLQHGAEICDFQADSRLFANGRLLSQQPSDLVAVAVSRPLLEDRVRQAVLSAPGVAVVAPAQLLDLRTRDRQVTGVRVRQGKVDTDVSAELVVDATGRGSHTPTWLAEHGFPRPIESTVDVGLSYASWVFPRRPADLDGARFLLLPPTPQVPRVGSALAIEGARWMVGCAGYRGDAAPLDLDGLARFVATLQAPDLADLIAGRRPLEPPRGHRFPASVRRRYEDLPTFPEGLLVTGDALSSFNPIYGQGMTIAAFEALALRDELAADGPDLPRRFFQRAARLIDVAWDLAAGGDLRLPVVPGRRSLRTRLVNAYVHRIGTAAARDPYVGRTFIRVVNLLDPPTALTRPAMLARVAAAGGATHHRSLPRFGAVP